MEGDPEALKSESFYCITEYSPEGTGIDQCPPSIWCSGAENCGYFSWLAHKIKDILVFVDWSTCFLL